MKTNTKTIISLIVVILTIVAIVLLTKGGLVNRENDLLPVEQATVSDLTSPVSTFTWRYEAGNMSLDGLPKTIVFLDVMYENKKILPIRIEEVEGSCNDVDPNKKEDTDMLDGTTKIQCYAAGFGELYKITNGADSYQVVRKHIEEGNPEVTPVNFEYEKITEVPLFQ